MHCILECLVLSRFLHYPFKIEYQYFVSFFLKQLSLHHFCVIKRADTRQGVVKGARDQSSLFFFNGRFSQLIETWKALSNTHPSCFILWVHYIFECRVLSHFFFALLFELDYQFFVSFFLTHLYP